MADYRREMNKSELKMIHNIYKIHTNNYGGLFTKDKRRKLLGLRLKDKKYSDDTADFWYDVRKNIRNGLKDLELFFEVAHAEQIKDIIHDSPLKEELDLPRRTQDGNKIHELYRQIPSLKQTLTALFKPHYQYKKMKSSSGQTQRYSELIEEDDEWKSILVHDIIKMCIKYLRDQNLISSKAHERLTDEFEDMVNVEIARGSKLSRNERVKGFV